MREVSHRAELDHVAECWQHALDGALVALDASDGTYPPAVLGENRREVAHERAEISKLLVALARTSGVPHMPWLAPSALHPSSLGLPAGTSGCIFDLEGVLTDSGVLHAHAWAEALDAFLRLVAEDAQRPFVPFDRDADYRAFFDGRPRLEGIRNFLNSRGIQAPEGHPADGEAARTVHGIARHKRDAVARALRRRSPSSLPGARRYLEAAGRAGVLRAVVSGSASTLLMLELADLEPLVEARIDAERIESEGLRSRPSPDVLVAACRLLGVRPVEAVTFTHTPEGVAAGRAAGLLVIGVGDANERARLEGFGADRVVARLTDLLEPRLRR